MRGGSLRRSTGRGEACLGSRSIPQWWVTAGRPPVAKRIAESQRIRRAGAGSATRTPTLSRIARCCVLAALLLNSPLARAADSGVFTVADIRIQGLQRVSAGTVFNLLPVKVGDVLDEVSVRQLIRLLFASGYFRDIRMGREGNVLIVTLSERPAIDSIEIKGNKSIKTEALLEGLGKQGLKEGEIFKQATLERVELELERQYVAQGRYGARLDAKVEDLPRNRVAIKIDIEEGKTSGIQHINFVGNRTYPDRDLLGVMELKHPGLFSFFRNDDKYSREKLTGDLEKIESFYKDRGHVEFDIESTQVSITPDKRQVYLTINLKEGDIYTVRNVDLVGELHDVPPEALRALILVQPGQIFSGARLTATEKQLTSALGNSGYTFATATGIPEVHPGGVVDVRFFVEAGKRAYVHRVEFSGNTVTQDEVLRREMRQMEGGWASTALIQLSKVRLERLGYFKSVNVETPEVPGTDDQIDVLFSVEEQPSGSISATLGYAQSAGLILGAGYQESNVLGTGNSLSLQVSWSEFQRAVSMNYFNPYFTLDGISRGYNIFYRETDFDEQNIASYSTDSYGSGVNFGFPIGETRRMGFGMSVEYTSITEGVYPAAEIAEYLREEGDTALNFKSTLSWTSSTLNRGLFATRGTSQSLALELAVPGSDNSFYKLTYQAQRFLPLTRALTMRFKTKLGYGDAYGSSDSLPFYEHFFSGGFGSVRGFKQNTLGPRATPNPFDPFTRENAPYGGNLLVEGSAEIILPLPFVKDMSSLRPVVYFDIGNVFNTNCPDVSVICTSFEADELRYSTGIAVTWLTGMGPMTFGLAKTFNTAFYDREETFQFELGRTF
jgi:outer membrane protein insertion porin family